MPKCLLFKSGVNIKPRGAVTPCCMYHIIDPQSPTVHDDWNAYYAKKSLEMESEWIPECRECEKLEQDGITSDRQYAETVCTGADYEYWDLELNNTCNLACRMCAPRSSSTFAKLVSDNKTLEWDSSYLQTQNKRWFKDSAIDNILEKIIHAKYIKFTGGEPFLIPQISVIVDHLIEQQVSKNIVLHFITNGTQPMTRWVDKFKHFDRVDVDISIDAVGKRYEYIRPGAKWDLVKKNIEFLVENHSDKCKVTLTSFPMLLNYNNLYEISEIAEQMGIEHNIGGELTNPPFLSLATLNDIELQAKFIQQMEIQDKLHGTDWRDFVSFDNNDSRKE